MRHFARAAAVAILASQGASAQAAEPAPLVRTCTVLAAAEKDQPRLVLVDTRSGDKITNYIQINGPTRLSGRLDSIVISIAPFDAAITVKGDAPQSGLYIRAIVTDGWESLLNRIRKGDKMTVTIGAETIVIPLVGSGSAVTALRRCSK